MAVNINLFVGRSYMLHLHIRGPGPRTPFPLCFRVQICERPKHLLFAECLSKRRKQCITLRKQRFSKNRRISNALIRRVKSVFFRCLAAISALLQKFGNSQNFGRLHYVGPKTREVKDVQGAGPELAASPPRPIQTRISDR